MRRIIVFAAAFLCISAYASKPVRVACLGDSITRGASLEDPDHQSFPAVLQDLLGDCYDVRNFGSDARVLVQTGDHPYMKEWRYDSLKTFLPDIVTIMLGTNDTKPQNWDAAQFKTDYAALIRDLKYIPSHPDIYICLPPPPYESKWGINDSTLVAGVIPIAKELAGRGWLEVIDFHTAMSGRPELFADKIHPNKEGAAFMAKMVYDSFMANGWTKQPGKRIVFYGDSITDGDWGKADGRACHKRGHYDMFHIYGHGYVEDCATYYLTKCPKKHYRFLNRGVSGDKLSDLYERFDEDVLTAHPDAISILVGVNDASGQTCETFDFIGWDKKYRDLIDRAIAFDPDCRIILCTPYLEPRGSYGLNGLFEARREVIDRLGVIVKKIAADYGLTCVDFSALMDKLLADDVASDRNYWTYDGIHPTMPGHQKMAELWIKKVGKRKI